MCGRGMAFSRLACIVLLCLGINPAFAWMSGGSAASVAPGSASATPSASTMEMSWSTSGLGNSSAACGTSPGTYTQPAADNYVQVQATAHVATVAGLTASTAYYCRGTARVNGDTLQFTASAATTAPPATTAVTGVTYGSPVDTNTLVPAGNATAGDSYADFISSDNVSYVMNNDTPNACNQAAQSSAIAIDKFVPESPLTCQLVNAMVNYGTQGQCLGTYALTAKVTGIYSHNGIIYYGEDGLAEGGGGAGCTGKFQPDPAHNYGPNIQPAYAGQIIKSPDHGASWANFQAPNSYNIHAAPTSPIEATMFTDIYTFRAVAFVVYGADDGTACGSSITPIDNCDAYTYLVGADPSWQNANNTYLARIATNKLPDLNPADIQYYTGGDGTYDAAWSSSSASMSAIISDTGKVGWSTITYIPKINRYVVFEWYYPNASVIDDTIFRLWEAPHPWGTWTLVNTSSDWNPYGFYMPTPTQRSSIAGSLLTLMNSGDFSNSTYYKLWTETAQLLCGAGSC